MLKGNYQRAQTSRPVVKELKDEKKVQDDLYVTVNMIDVLENYRKSVDFYNSYDEKKNKQLNKEQA